MALHQQPLQAGYPIIEVTAGNNKLVPEPISTTTLLLDHQDRPSLPLATDQHASSRIN
jgi:hypothetical protein